MYRVCVCIPLRCHFTPAEMDQPPVAKVLSSATITLPVRTAVLDGSRSTDDKGGITYLWTRDESSPAAGVSSQLQYSTKLTSHMTALS